MTIGKNALGVEDGHKKLNYFDYDGNDDDDDYD